jgi:hypothetical protein
LLVPPAVAGLGVAGGATGTTVLAAWGVLAGSAGVEEVDDSVPDAALELELCDDSLRGAAFSGAPPLPTELPW